MRFLQRCVWAVKTSLHFWSACRLPLVQVANDMCVRSKAFASGLPMAPRPVRAFEKYLRRAARHSSRSSKFSEQGRAKFNSWFDLNICLLGLAVIWFDLFFAIFKMVWFDLIFQILAICKNSWKITNHQKHWSLLFLLDSLKFVEFIEFW